MDQAEFTRVAVEEKKKKPRYKGLFYKVDDVDWITELNDGMAREGEESREGAARSARGKPIRRMRPDEAMAKHQDKREVLLDQDGAINQLTNGREPLNNQSPVNT